MTTPQLFNGPIEMGLRVMVLLLESFPSCLDLQRLVVLDYLLVHSADIVGGPTSVHPPSPLRAGEVAVRRDLIEQGLNLYACHGLVKRQLDANGIRYEAEDIAATFLDALTSDYVRKLRDRAHWIFETFGSRTDDEIETILNETIGRWRTEFTVLEADDYEV